jgi:NAD(P)-dependent dehydrogenase (short-subunit alcohol dehydrogenase family)
MDLRGRLVVVTGAASGIGQACALAVGGRGATLWLVDVDGPGLDATLADLPAGAHATRILDVTDVAALTGMFAEAADRGLDLAGVVNAAGILTGGAPWPVGDLDRMQQVLRVNVSGALSSTTLAARYLLPGERAVVNISSSTALRPHPADPAYAASKAALVSLSRSTAAAVAGVRVNVVLPGAVRTPMLAATLGANAPAGGDGNSDGVADWLAERMSRPMLTPEQVAGSVCELLTGSAHNGVAWKIDVDPNDPTEVRTTEVP